MLKRSIPIVVVEIEFFWQVSEKQNCRQVHLPQSEMTSPFKMLTTPTTICTANIYLKKTKERNRIKIIVVYSRASTRYIIKFNAKECDSPSRVTIRDISNDKNRALFQVVVLFIFKKGRL